MIKVIADQDYNFKITTINLILLLTILEFLSKSYQRLTNELIKVLLSKQYLYKTIAESVS
jgi:hypothetical protein